MLLQGEQQADLPLVERYYPNIENTLVSIVQRIQEKYCKEIIGGACLCDRVHLSLSSISARTINTVVTGNSLARQTTEDHVRS
jgi:hypothetical protein